MITAPNAGDDPRRLWRTVRELIAAFEALRNEVRSKLPPYRRRQVFGGTGVATPFRIVPAASWLQVTVNDGYVITTGDPILVTGYGFTCGEGEARTWIYLDVTTSTAELFASASTLTWGVDKIPIGWVDTSDTENETQIITQFVHDNIFIPCAPAPPEE